jgi:uncharacterized cupredoxin-like copper-binding protein
MPRSFFAAAACAALLSHALDARAHGPAHAAVAPLQVETEFGRTGNPRRVSRTVQVDMADTMRFTPAEITVRRGETVRFRLRNVGKAMHEFVLGTQSELEAHAELMRKHPGMQHDEPFMAHVAPGARGEVVWQFTQAGDFRFGCLLPGHYEAGMHGRVRVVEPREGAR